MHAFLSTPKFIKYLTDISDLLMQSQDKRSTLREELRKLNHFLPSSVYIPLVTRPRVTRAGARIDTQLRGAPHSAEREHRV